MTYQETIDYLFSRLPMFHRVGAAALKPGLDNITALCSHLGDPQTRFRSIHIAGTNGKGSTANFLASVLQEAGYKTGLFTSPHLRDFRERIRINGQMILEEKVCAFVQDHKTDFEKVEASFFEYTTAMAFWYFSEEKVDIAVVETGLGGRLDSTNILRPVLSIITSISSDHTHLLGSTLPVIAWEKAGIIKPGTPVVLATNTPEVFRVVEQMAETQRAELHTTSGLMLPPELDYGLKGQYQQENVKTVLKAIGELRKQGWQISDEAVKKGLKDIVKNTGFRGRWEQIGEEPKMICDVAHNEEGIAWVVKQLRSMAYRDLHIVFGVVKDKEVGSMLELLPPEARYYFVRANVPRALDAEELEKIAAEKGLKGDAYATVEEGMSAARKAAQSEDVIFIGGSFFVVAEVLP